MHKGKGNSKPKGGASANIKVTKTDPKPIRGGGKSVKI